MKHVLADWGDEDAACVLRACRAALRSAGNKESSSGGRIVVADVVLPVGSDANGSDDLNLAVDACLMLVGNRGERTHTRWQQLAAAAGLELESVVKTASPSIDLVVFSVA